jgi:hypothetical protein
MNSIHFSIKNEILKIEATWIALVITTLIEIIQAWKDKCHMTSLICAI